MTSNYILAYIKRHGLTGTELPVKSAQPSFSEYYGMDVGFIPNLGRVSAQPITNLIPFTKFNFEGTSVPAIFKYSVNGGPWSYYYYDSETDTGTKLDVASMGSEASLVQRLTADLETFVSDISKKDSKTVQKPLSVILIPNSKNEIRFLTFYWDKFRFPSPSESIIVSITHDADWNEDISIYDLVPLYPSRTPNNIVYVRLSGLKGKFETVKIRVGDDGQWVEYPSIDSETYLAVALPTTGMNSLKILRKDENAVKYPHEKFAQTVKIDYDPMMDASWVENTELVNNLPPTVSSGNFDWIVTSSERSLLKYRVNNKPWSQNVTLVPGDNIIPLNFDPGKNILEYIKFNNEEVLWPTETNANKHTVFWKLFDLNLLAPAVTPEKDTMVAFADINGSINLRYKLNDTSTWTTLNGVNENTNLILSLLPGKNTLYALVQSKDGTWPDARFALEFVIEYDPNFDISGVANMIPDGSVKLQSESRVPSVQYKLQSGKKIFFKTCFETADTPGTWSAPQVMQANEEKILDLLLTYGNNKAKLLVWNEEHRLWPMESKSIDSSCEFKIPMFDVRTASTTSRNTAYYRLSNIDGSENIKISVNNGSWKEQLSVSASQILTLENITEGKNTVRILVQDKTSGQYAPDSFSSLNTFDVTYNLAYIPSTPVENMVLPGQCIGDILTNKAVWEIGSVSAREDTMFAYQLDAGMWRGPVTQKAGQGLSLPFEDVSLNSTIKYLVLDPATMLWPAEDDVNSIEVDMTSDLHKYILSTMATPATGVKVLNAADVIHPLPFSIATPVYNELPEDVYTDAGKLV